MDVFGSPPGIAPAAIEQLSATVAGKIQKSDRILLRNTMVFVLVHIRHAECMIILIRNGGMKVIFFPYVSLVVI